MAQNYVYPASSQVTVSGIGTPNNAPIPSSSVLIAGESPTGNQAVVQTDSAGNLIVSPLASSSTVTVVQPTGTNLHAVIDSQALPTGASTSALQTSGNSLLSTVASNQTNGTQITAINNFPATQPISGTVAVSAIAGALPTGANSIGSVSVSNFPATQPVSGTVAISNFPATQAISAASLPLPAGASTSALQTTGNTSLASIVTNTTGASTAALQTTGNSSLASIVTNTGIKTNNGTLTDSSTSTSATPSTSTTLVAANAARRYLLVQNVSTTDTVWINFTSAATAGLGSFMLLPGGVLAQETGFVSTEAVTGLSTTASVPVTIKQA